jgi:hypothetical protein
MDIILDPNLLVILCLVSFIAGFIDAIVGGGGMLTIPTLLASGLPPHLVLGTNKLAATFGSFTASLTFYRKKLFNPYFWRTTLIATAIGAVIGTVVVTFLPEHFLSSFLPILVLCTAIYNVFSKKQNITTTALPPINRLFKLKQWLQGLTLGFYDGVAGPGTGAFWMTSSALLYKINLLLCSGLSRSNNFVSNLCSLITFIYLGQVNFYLGLFMGFFIMLGAWVGAHSAIKFGAKFIQPLFTIVVITLSIYLFLKQ